MTLSNLPTNPVAVWNFFTRFFEINQDSMSDCRFGVSSKADRSFDVDIQIVTAAFCKIDFFTSLEFTISFFETFWLNSWPFSAYLVTQLTQFSDCGQSCVFTKSNPDKLDFGSNMNFETLSIPINSFIIYHNELIKTN